jgi:hypothetical protein
METVNTACLPVKRRLRCTAHVAVALGRSVLSISEKCWSISAALLQQLNISAYVVIACGKTKSPRLASPYSSSRTQLHLTPIACSPE